MRIHLIKYGFEQKEVAYLEIFKVVEDSKFAICFKQITSESRLKQVALPQAEDMRKIWDINDHRAKAVHI